MIPILAAKQFIKQIRNDLRAYKKKSPEELLNLLPTKPFLWDKLKLHQKVTVALGIKYKGLGIWLDPGLGKTLASIVLLKYFKAKTLVLVPYETILSEWEREIIKHAPKTSYVILSGSSETKWQKLNENPEADITIVTYPGLMHMVCEKVIKKKKKRLDINTKRMKIIANMFECLVMDECFIKGTKIETIDGYKNIENINKGDVIISSYGNSIVRKIYCKKTQVIVKLKLNNGITIGVTPNHPFLTNFGWVCAGNLENYHVLIRPTDLRTLRNYLYSEILPSEDKTAAEILWQIVCDELDKKSTRSTKTNESKEKGSSNEFRKQKEIKQNKKIFWTNLLRNWWKRTRINPTTENFAKTIRPALGTRISNHIGKKAARLSNELYGRFGTSEKQVDYRMRRTLSLLQQQAQKERPETGQETFGIGVEDIAIEKFRYPIDVFDLHLQGTPHFCAEGVLVHNSHHVGNRHKLPFRICRQITNKTKYNFGLSGSPFGRDPLLLWAQMFLIDRGESLGKNLGIFRSVFYKEVENPFSAFPDYEFDAKKKPFLNRCLAHKSIRYKANAADIPKAVSIVKEIKLMGDANEYYQKALENLRASKGNIKEMKNMFLRLRQISSGWLGYQDEEEGTRAQIEFPKNKKLDLLLSIVDSIYENHKIVIMHDFVFSGSIIARELDKLNIGYVRIYGKTKKAEIPNILNSFDNDQKVRILVGNRAASLGLNLQVAQYMIFYESTPSVIVRKQMEARIERQGSTHDKIFRYDLVVKNTVDEKILQFHQEGKDLWQEILEGRTKL